jgi:hypothetical protein
MSEDVNKLSLNELLTHPFFVQLADALRKVNVNPPVVDENIVHFEVGLFTIFPVFEFDESVLQGIARLFIPNDFAAKETRVVREPT